MTIQVALLRGINVGGRRKVGMAELRALLAKMGLTDVQSVLQSGNLVFRSVGIGGARLEQALEAEAEKRLGLNAAFLVRTAVEWRAILQGNPFPQLALDAPARLVVMCLKKAPDPAAVKALQQAASGPESFKATGRELYIHYPDGQGTSRFSGALIERTLGTTGSARNWNTVERLDALANP